MKKSELVFSSILVPIDYIMIVAAGLVAYYLRFQSALIEIRPVFYEMSFSYYLFLLLIVAAVFILIFVMTGLYKIQGTRKAIDELLKVFIACSTGVLLIIIIIFFQRELFSSRFIILSGWVISIIFVSLARVLVRAVQRSLFKKGIGIHNVIVVGNDKTTEEIVKYMHLKPSLGFRMVMKFDDFNEDNLLKAKTLAKEGKIDEVLQTGTALPKEEILRILDFCNDYHIIYKYAAGLIEAQSTHLEINTLAGIPIVEVKKTPLDGWGRIIKRFVDVAISIFVLMLLSPLFLIVAVAVKLDSAGPVFVRLERIGEQGQHFILFKFRSMIKNAQAMKKNLLAMNERRDGPLFKIKNDPRITRVGRFIRKTSLDELPQFINVIKGDMSLVGPRPHEPEEVASYKKHHRKLLTIKPGITGMAQISGRSDLSFEEEVKLDTYYIENWSLKLDLQIMLKTPFVVITTKSAS